MSERGHDGGPDDGRFDVCVVGSANLDLVVQSPRHPQPGETLLGTGYAEHPGGKGLNQAVAAARAGVRTAMVGALGTDAAGDGLAAVLEHSAVDHRLVERVDVPTGRALITVSDASENTIVVVPGANGLVHANVVPPATVVLVQLEVPLDAVAKALQTAKTNGSRTVLNPAPAADLPADLLAAVDVIVPNQHEAELLGGVDALRRSGVSTIVMTLGADGAEIIDATGKRRVPAFAVEPVDTTAAGDSFCGMLCARLAAGADLDAAVIWAAAAGALATTAAGAVPSIPTRDAVAALIDRHPS